jgi:hypothetical protein
MLSMGNVDIEGSIEFFRSHGGGRDCEILFNVECSPPKLDSQIVEDRTGRSPRSL